MKELANTRRGDDKFLLWEAEGEKEFLVRGD